MTLPHVRVTSQYDSRRPPYWTVWWLESISVIVASVTFFEQHFRTKILVQMTFYYSNTMDLIYFSIMFSFNTLCIDFLLKVLDDNWALNVTWCTFVLLFCVLFCVVLWVGWSRCRGFSSVWNILADLLICFVCFRTLSNEWFCFDNDIPSDDPLLKFAVVAIWNMEYMRFLAFQMGGFQLLAWDLSVRNHTQCK